eukprot:m.111042 g.111042  ORF g.111042 m.111042 type:complete len:1240 (+) comp9232_c0_seq1:101-3820(+)
MEEPGQDLLFEDDEAGGITLIHFYASEGDLENLEIAIEQAEDGAVNFGDDQEKTPVIYSVLANSQECVKLLHSYGADLNIPDDTGRTPLHWACIEDDADMLRLLLSLKADQRLADEEGNYPIHLACHLDGEKCLDVLLEQDLTVVEILDNEGLSPIHWCAHLERGNHIEEIVKKGGSLNVLDRFGKMPIHWTSDNTNATTCQIIVKHEPEQINAVDSDGRTTLIMAIGQGNSAVADVLFASEGIDVNIADNSGRTALHWAAVVVNEEALKKLIKSKANPNAIDFEGATPLHYLVQHPVAESGLKYFLDNIEGLEDIKDNENHSIFFWAIEAGNIPALQLLMECKSVSLTSTDSLGNTPLHFACKKGDIDVVRVLLQHVNVNTRNNAGQTALFSACSGGHPSSLSIVKLLLESKADIRMVDRFGLTLIHWVASVEGELCDFICNMIWDEAINAFDNEGHTALHFAIYANNIPCATSLVEAGWNVNQADDNRITPLHWACMRGSYPMAKLLLDNGAEANLMEGKDRYTPLDFLVLYANESKVDMELAELLRAHGAVTCAELQEEAVLIIQKHWKKHKRKVNLSGRRTARAKSRQATRGQGSMNLSKLRSTKSQKGMRAVDMLELQAQAREKKEKLKGLNKVILAESHNQPTIEKKNSPVISKENDDEPFPPPLLNEDIIKGVDDVAEYDDDLESDDGFPDKVSTKEVNTLKRCVTFSDVDETMTDSMAPSKNENQEEEKEGDEKTSILPEEEVKEDKEEEEKTSIHPEEEMKEEKEEEGVTGDLEGNKEVKESEGEKTDVDKRINEEKEGSEEDRDVDNNEEANAAEEVEMKVVIKEENSEAQIHGEGTEADQLEDEEEEFLEKVVEENDTLNSDDGAPEELQIGDGEPESNKEVHDTQQHVEENIAEKEITTPNDGMSEEETGEKNIDLLGRGLNLTLLSPIIEGESTQRRDGASSPTPEKLKANRELGQLKAHPPVHPHPPPSPSSGHRNRPGSAQYLFQGGVMDEPKELKRSQSSTGGIIPTQYHSHHHHGHHDHHHGHHEHDSHHHHRHQSEGGKDVIDSEGHYATSPNPVEKHPHPHLHRGRSLTPNDQSLHSHSAHSHSAHRSAHGHSAHGHSFSQAPHFAFHHHAPLSKAEEEHEREIKRIYGEDILVHIDDLGLSPNHRRVGEHNNEYHLPKVPDYRPSLRFSKTKSHGLPTIQNISKQSIKFAFQAYKPKQPTVMTVKRPVMPKSTTADTTN